MQDKGRAERQKAEVPVLTTMASTSSSALSPVHTWYSKRPHLITINSAQKTEEGFIASVNQVGCMLGEGGENASSVKSTKRLYANMSVQLVAFHLLHKVLLVCNQYTFLVFKTHQES